MKRQGVGDYEVSSPRISGGRRRTEERQPRTAAFSRVSWSIFGR